MSDGSLNSSNEYDVIVIGSGIGGLTAAAFLSKVEGKRVLVLEKHYIPGGLTHSFSRKKFRWDVGIHYVGRMFKGSIQRAVMDFITDNQLEWKSLPKNYERFIYPDKTVPVSRDVEEFKQVLFSTYPNHVKEIKRYFTLINRGALWFSLNFLAENLPRPLSTLLNLIKRFISVDTHKSTTEYIDEITQNRELTTLLTSQWADYGVSPLEGSFIMHATTVKHFMTGGFVPKGGSEQIVTTIEPVISAKGGAILTRHEVNEIILDGDRVTGVTATHKGEQCTFKAPVVIANCGSYLLYNRLLSNTVSASHTKDVSQMDTSTGAVIVYLGLKDSPEKIGIKGENIWINKTGKTHTLAEISKALMVDKSPLGCYLSFHTKESDSDPVYVSTIIATVDYSYFDKWREQPCMKRDEEYQKLKGELAEALITLADEKLPGLKDLIEYNEVGTPLTLEHFSAKRNGAMYGIKTTPSFFPHKVYPVKSEIKGLYQAGTDVCAPGFVAAMMGGVAAAGSIISPIGMIKLLAKARIASKFKR